MVKRVGFVRWRAARAAARATALSVLVPGALLATGCANDAPRIRRVAPWVFRSARHVGVGTGRPTPPAPPAGDENASLVVGQIHAAGYHFGTDGSPGALW